MLKHLFATVPFWLSLHLAAQEPLGPYQPLPVFNTPAYWSEEGALWCNYQGLRYFTLPTDTVIAGVGVGKPVFYQPTYSGSTPCPIGFFTLLTEAPRFVGLLSQDVVSKKVWFRRLTSQPFLDQFNEMPADSGQLVLLYDFDLEVGDTLTWKTPPNVVTATDEVLYNDGVLHKRYFFSSPEFGLPPDGYYHWIEGVGSTHGLFGAYQNPYYTDQYYFLNCFRSDNVLIFNRVEAQYCDGSTATDNPSAGKRQVSVSPNPVAGPSFGVELPDGLPLAQLRLFDARGALLWEKNDVSSGRTEVPAAELRNGFYALQVRWPDGQQVLRRVVVLR